MTTLNHAYKAIAENFHQDKNIFKVSEVIDSLSHIIPTGDLYKAVRQGVQIKRGHYDLEAVLTPFRQVKPQLKKSLDAGESVIETPNFDQIDTNSIIEVPKKVASYVTWGNFDDIKTIIQSESFFPTFISGLSGNGKTMMVEQAAARANRKLIRVQITPETDETDLIGGFQLINGNTIFVKGPVIQAMEQGAVCLLDEIDRGTNKLMCLQSVLEGNSVLLKKTGEVVKPTKGFNVIATANTKGQGSDDGRFAAASILDDAFLERFTITIEQFFPPFATEKRIIKKHMEMYGVEDEEFLDKLTIWSDAIRKTFEDGGIDEVVSTRRLCHIIHTFSIFKDRLKSIDYCISRFDADTKEAFLDLYTKIDVQSEKPTTDPVDDLLKNNQSF